MKRLRYLVIPLLFALLASISMSFLSNRSGASGLSDGRLRDCDSKSNCVCSERPGESFFIEPIAIEGNVDAAFRSLLEFLQEAPRVSIAEYDSTYIHSVFKTRLMRFCDDVEFRLDREAGVIHVRSASRVGYSDLGKNRSRVESIRRELNALVTASDSARVAP